MPEPRSRTKRKTLSVGIVAAIIVAVATIIAALSPIVYSLSMEFMRRTPVQSTPTPFCVGTENIIVMVTVLNDNGDKIDMLIANETFPIESGSTVFFRVEISSVDELPEPKMVCTWTDNGIAAEGSLLSKSGCTVGYQFGSDANGDTISLQLTQPPCSPLAPYAFFLSPKR